MALWYAPYTQALEPAVEHLAASFAGDPTIRVVKLRGDAPGARAFARDVLQVGLLAHRA
jgi:hypothetical protein